MTRYFEVTDRDCTARIGRRMLDQRIRAPAILELRIAQEALSLVKRGITERRGKTGRGTVCVLKGSNDPETTQCGHSEMMTTMVGGHKNGRNRNNIG